MILESNADELALMAPEIGADVIEKRLGRYD